VTKRLRRATRVFLHLTPPSTPPPLSVKHLLIPRSPNLLIQGTGFISCPIFQCVCSEILEMDYDTSRLQEYRGRNGLQLSFSCPPGIPNRNVWGTKIYTDDSSVCKAAIHAGVLTSDVGGTGIIEVYPGIDNYESTTANGWTTIAYGYYEGSFFFHG